MNKNKEIILIVIILIVSGCINKEDNSYKNNTANNGKIAILIDPKWNWSNGYPQTDYLKILRETKSALDYMGYRYDILGKSISEKELYSYDLLITIAGEDIKVIDFTEKTGRTVVIFNKPSEKLLSKINDKPNMWKTDIIVDRNTCIKSELTDKIYDDYGTFAIYHVFDINYTEATILCKTEGGTPILVEQFYNGGHYIFIPSKVTTWNQYNYNLLSNIIKRNTQLLNIGSIPYAQDVAIIVRLDDFTTDYNASFTRYLEITKDLSIGSIMNKTSREEISKIDGDVLPHGFDHEDHSTLNYTEEENVLYKSKEKYYEFTGNYPRGYIAPYNRISKNTTVIGNNLGFNYFTTYIGIADVPRHYYENDTNNVWILGSRTENFSNYMEIKYVLDIYGKRGGIAMFVDHPYDDDDSGIINSSLKNFKFITEFINNNQGYYLTTIDDFFQKLIESKYVTIIDSKLIVEKNIDSGLTLCCMTYRDKIKIGNLVMIYYRENMTVLPSLSKGEYKIEHVNGYPTIKSIQKGLIKSAIFNVDTNITTIIAYSSTNSVARLILDDLEPFNRYSLYERNTNKSRDFVTNGEGSINIDVELKGGNDQELELIQR